MKSNSKRAAELHHTVPPNWYYRSVKVDKNPIRRWVHLTRFKEISKVIEPVEGRVLDIGSADGMFSEVILEKTAARKVIGVDVLEKSVAWANKHWKDEKRLKFRVADAHGLPFEDETFEAVFALEVLEHVFEPVKVLQEIKRVLKEDGYAVFLVPAESFLFRLIWYFWTKYTESKIWKETHVHAYSGDFLAKLVKALGYKIEVDKKIIFGTLHLIKVKKY